MSAAKKNMADVQTDFGFNDPVRSSEATENSGTGSQAVPSTAHTELAAGADFIGPRRPVPAIGMFRFFEGFNGKAPTPLGCAKINYTKESADRQEKSAEEAVVWIRRYSKIPDDDRLARAQFLVPQIQEFGFSLGLYLAKNLRCGVALFLMLRDSIYKGFVDAAGQPLFPTKGAFIAAFLQEHGLSEEHDQISRLLRAASLWVAIVDAGLPFPAVLSRLYLLLTLPSQGVALWLYGELSKEAGDTEPSCAAIEAAVKKWNPPKTSRLDARDWRTVLLQDGREAEAMLASKTPDIQEARRILVKIITVLERRVPQKKNGRKKKGPQQPAALMPTKPCPLSLHMQDHHLELDLRGAAPEVISTIEKMAPGLNWNKTESERWRLCLPKGASASNAKRHHMREWLTRVLERLDYRGPPELIST